MDRRFSLSSKLSRVKGLTFDDVLLLPGYTDFKRDEVDLSVRLHSKVRLTLPIISSPMDTVTEMEMASSLARAGGLGIIHRNLSVVSQTEMVRQIKTQGYMVGAAVGVGDFKNRIKSLISCGVDVVCLDSGHGHTTFMRDAVRFIKREYSSTIVMGGNVATYEGARFLIKAGVDILRVGMGPGSICTTRIVTGMGVPQLTAISEAVRATKGTRVTVVADGGIKQIGDIAKALAIGADAVMLGSLLARFDQSPGDTIVIEGKKYKQYRGMGSVASMQKGAAERYGQSTHSSGKALIPEGIEGLVSYQGTVHDYLVQIKGSLRSSCYYVGARTLKEFAQKSQLIKISSSGLIESHPHSVLVKDVGANYSL